MRGRRRFLAGDSSLPVLGPVCDASLPSPLPYVPSFRFSLLAAVRILRPVGVLLYAACCLRRLAAALGLDL